MRKSKVFWGISLLISMGVLFGMKVQSYAKSHVPEVVEIKVGGVMTLTGPGAFWHGPGGKAEMVFFKYFNKNGGMEYTEPDGSKHRFKINFKYEDCAYSPKKAVTSYGRLRDWGAKLITTHGSSPGAALMAICARDKVPVLHMWAVHPDPKYFREHIDEMYLLPASATDVDATMAIFYLFKRYVWDKKHPGKALKAGIIAFDNPPRRLYKKPFVKKFYKKIGVDLVGASIVPITVTDTTIELKRLHNAGAKLILVDHTIGGLKVILEDAQRLGIKDNLYWIAWFNLLRQFLAAPELFDGVYNPWSYPMYYSKKKPPAVERVGKLYLNEDPDYWTYRVDWALGPYHTLTLGMLAIKMCLEKYGYKGFTRERLRDILFSGLTVDTGIYPKFKMDPQFPYSAPYAWFYQLDAKNKIYVRIADKPAAMGPSYFQPRWNPGDNPNAVHTHYYAWP